MKKLFIILTVISLLFLSACGNEASEGSNVTDPADQGSAGVVSTAPTASQDQLIETTAPVAASPEEAYDAIISKLYTRLNKIIGDDTHLDGLRDEVGMVGIAEVASHGGVDMLDKIGYSVVDINDDGISELVICHVDEFNKEMCNGTQLLCVYTASDNVPKLVLESHSRSSFYLTADGQFYYRGSNGADDTIMGIYDFQPHSMELTCVDYYFTDVDSNGNPLFYHNQTGEHDAAASEPFNGDKDAFFAIGETMAKKIKTVDLHSLSTYEG